MYYASETHEGFIDRESFENVQALLEKRQMRYGNTAVGQKVYPLTSKIQCAECGAFFRRKICSGQIKWICSKHNEDRNSCDSFYYGEDRIYNGFLTMINKLKFGEERILNQVISKLEMANMIHKKNNQTAREFSQSIAEINSKLLMLDQLHSKGYMISIC